VTVLAMALHTVEVEDIPVVTLVALLTLDPRTVLTRLTPLEEVATLQASLRTLPDSLLTLLASLPTLPTQLEDVLLILLILLIPLLIPKAQAKPPTPPILTLTPLVLEEQEVLDLDTLPLPPREHKALAHLRALNLPRALNPPRVRLSVELAMVLQATKLRKRME